jgi:GAF domain-containing protein
MGESIGGQPETGEHGGSVVGPLRQLCTATARALSASGAGVSVMTGAGIQGLAAASDPVSERLEELQFALGEGPCIDAFATRRPVLISAFDDAAMRRWPGYTSAVRGDGVRAVFAFPLQVGAASLGVLDVFRTRPGPLSAAELGQALAFADTAVTTLLDGQQRAPAGEAADGLDTAMDRHVEVFQAQGMVMVLLGSTLSDALARMRAQEGRP